MAYLDGQLASERHAEIAKLAEESWELRVRLSNLERDIETYTEATSYLDPSEIPPFENIWKDVSVGTDSRLMERPRVESQGAQAVRKGGESFPLPRWLGLRAFPRFLTVRWITVAVSVFVVIVFLIRLSLAPPVSARELLERAESAEAQRLRVVSQPVVYQKLQVRRQALPPHRDEVVTWEIWNDPANHRSRQRIEDIHGPRVLLPFVENSQPPAQASQPVDKKLASQGSQLISSLEAPLPVPSALSELEQIFQANSMDGLRPLSAGTFSSWQQRTPLQSQEVSKSVLLDGARAFVLKASTKPNGALHTILRGELVVRAQDWHPVEHRMKVHGADGVRDYALSEVAYDVIALNTLTPAFFSKASLSDGSVPPPQAAMALPLELPSNGDLLASEVETHYPLHRLKACLGEQIEVKQMGRSRIEVRGLATSTERKEEILEALRSIPWVTAHLQTIAEALQVNSSSSRAISSNVQPRSETTSNQPTIMVHSERLPIQDQLQQYFIKQEALEIPGSNRDEHKVNLKMAALAKEAVSLSRSTLADAWALRRLAERFDVSQTSLLKLQPKWLLEVMVRDHLAAVLETNSRSRRLLEPVLSALTAAKAVPAEIESSTIRTQANSENPGWSSKVVSLFATVEENDQLTHGLFAGAGLPPSQLEAAVNQIVSSFSRLEGKSRNLELSMAREFSGNPDSQSFKNRSE